MPPTKLCIGRETFQGISFFRPSIWATCGNPPGPRNQRWCNDCDDIRMSNISKVLEEASEAQREVEDKIMRRQREGTNL